MPPGARGHQHNPSYGAGSISGQKAFLVNAYQELGKELYSQQIKVVGNYTLGRIIGEGSFGCVRLALHRLTATRCAVKQIPRSATPPLLTREIHHHRRLHHPHVVQLYEIIATETHIWLAFELCAGGELFDYLVEQGRLHESEARRVFGQLCLGIGYIHACGVVHRDLKLENVLLDERCNVKIADFGFGREFEKGRLMETYCGTTGYASPEMLQGKKYTGEEVDIWSLGVILYALLTGSLPFDDDDEEAMKRKIMALEYDIPLWLPEDVRDLISKILVLDPRQRPTIKDILAHAWFWKPIMPYVEGQLQQEPPIPEEETTNHARESTSSTFESTDFQDTSLATGSGPDGSLLAESQLTLRSPTLAPSNSVDGFPTAVPRHPTIAQLAESRAAHEDEYQSSSPYPRQSRPPPVSRTMSRSSSINSPAIPFVAHSRTPSRTKRRSVGSSFSERMLPAPLPPIVDYASMLDGGEPEPFNTSLEKTLLDSVSAIGMDAGQMIHSIKTNACDCSAAIWWQLKRKAEDKADTMSEGGSFTRSPAEVISRRAKASTDTQLDSPQIKRSTSPVAIRSSRIEELNAVSSRKALHERRNSIPSPGSPLVKPTSRKRSISSAAQMGGSASNSRPETPVQPTALATSTSMPILSFTAAETMSETDVGASGRPTGPQQMPEVIARPSAPTQSNSSPESRRPDKHRSTSVSILQRATSALISGNPSSSTKEARSNSGEHIPDSGRATPLAAIFGRKSSGNTVTEKTSRERLRDFTFEAKPYNQDSESEQVSPHSSPKNLKSSPDTDTFKDSPAMRSESSLNSGTQESASSHPSASQTSPASSASGLTQRNSKQQQQSSRTSLFSSFRMWFNEDRRKRKRSISVTAASTNLSGFEGSSVTKLRVASNQSPTMSIAAGPKRDHSAIVQSPLRRQSAQRPSSQASHAGHSRRSSIASVSHAEGSEMQRRQSATSIRSNLSRQDARPSSVASTETSTVLEGTARNNSLHRRGSQTRHKRHGSTSSIGSKASGRASPSHAAFRRPPTTATQVRRISRPTHHRRDSASSSIRSTSSRRSSFSEDDNFLSHGIGTDHEPIQEEEETDGGSDVQEQRMHALRKLSGDLSRQMPLPPPPAKTIFTAHKATSVFGSPALVGYTRSASSSTIKPSKSNVKLRDVFKSNKKAKSADEDDEWVDEDDPLGGYGSGFGQSHAGEASQNGPASAPQHIIGSGRYAGLNEATMPSQHTQGRPVGLGLKGPPPISEEEEEEE